MAAASMYRDVFLFAKASHKRSQSNFRVIVTVVLITTTSVPTILSRIFSDHVELHTRHVHTSV